MSQEYPTWLLQFETKLFYMQELVILSRGQGKLTFRCLGGGAGKYFLTKVKGDIDGYEFVFLGWIGLPPLLVYLLRTSP